MFSNPFRVLVAVACAFALFVGSAVALADQRPLSKKERRKFDRVLKKQLRQVRSDLADEAKTILREAKRVRRDSQAGRLTGRDRDIAIAGVCVDLSFFRFPEANLGEDEFVNPAEVAVSKAVSAAIGDEAPVTEFLAAFESLPSSIGQAADLEVRALRQRLAIAIEDEKARVEALPDSPTAEEKFEFEREAESHSVVSQPSGTRLDFVRPGLRRLEVTESGDVKVEVAVAFDEPDSFVRIELKRPDGTVLSTFDAQQKDSTNGESRQLAFEFTLDTLPAAGEPVLFTASSGFDQSFLSLVDPFDCLAFLFPGLVTPSTPQTPSSAKPE